MSLAELENWSMTAHGLHKGALLLGAIQRLTQPPQPAYLELGLQVVNNGLSSGVLPSGGRMILDFQTCALVYNHPDGHQVSLPLDRRSQAQIFQEMFEFLSKDELAGLIPYDAGMDLFECVSQGIAARGGRYRPPRSDLLLDENPIQIDPHTAERYFQVVQMVFTSLARFLAHHAGLKTPLVVWPEHFDLSTLLFVGCEIDESQPHMNFGFAPYSDGIDFPYLYVYAYPYPDQFETPSLPIGTYWHTQGWTGAVLPYEVIAAQSDPADFIEESCGSIYAALRPLLKD